MPINGVSQWKSQDGTSSSEGLSARDSGTYLPVWESFAVTSIWDKAISRGKTSWRHCAGEVKVQSSKWRHAMRRGASLCLTNCRINRIWPRSARRLVRSKPVQLHQPAIRRHFSLRYRGQYHRFVEVP